MPLWHQQYHSELKLVYELQLIALILERSRAEPKHGNRGALGSAQSLSTPVSALEPSGSRAELSGGNTRSLETHR